MAINSRKISSFSQLKELTGAEYLMVAYKNKSYKVPTSLLIGNMIDSISQKKSNEDGANNPITVQVSTGEKYTFDVYNGKKGSTGNKGETGEKGQRGDSGVAIYDQTTLDQLMSLIIGTIDNAEGLSEDILTKRMASAAMAVILNDQISELKEVYFDSQDEYDKAENDGKILDEVKYFIYEE